MKPEPEPKRPTADAVKEELFRDLLAIEDFAKAVNVCERTIINHSRRGLKLVHVGRKPYVHVPSALAFYRDGDRRVTRRRASKAAA